MKQTRLVLGVVAAVVFVFAASSFAEDAPSGPPRAGLIVQSKGFYGEVPAEAARCVVGVFEHSDDVRFEIVDAPKKTDRLSLAKWGKEKGLDEVVVLELRGGAPPMVMAQSVGVRSYSSSIVSRSVDGNGGRACDAAYFALMEIYGRKPSTAVQALITRATQFYQRSDSASAAGYLGQAMETDPAEPAPVRMLGRIYQIGGDLETAMLWYRQATEMRLADGPTFSEAAMAFLAAGETEEGMSLLQQAVARGARVPHYYRVLGRYYYEGEQYASAIENLTDARRLDPRGFAELPILIDALAREERWSEAAALTGEINKAGPTYDGLMTQATYHEYAEEYAQAADILRGLVTVNPGDPDLRRRLGEALEKSGRVDEALAVLVQTVEQDPKNARAWITLGGLYYRQKKFAEAISALQTARGIEPADPQALRLEAMAREFSGDVDGAMANYAEALLRDTSVRESDMVRYLLVAKKNNRLGLAVTSVQDMLPYKGLDDRRTLVMALGQRLVEDGDIDGAIALYRRSADTLGRYAPPYVALGDLYLKRQNWEEAAGSFMAATSMYSDPLIPLYAGQKFQEAGQWEKSRAFYSYSFGINSENAACVVGLAEVSLITDQDRDLINYYINEANALAKSESLTQRYYFLQAMWALRYGESDLANDTIRYTLERFAKQPVQAGAPWTVWSDWAASAIGDEDSRALAADVVKLFDGRVNTANFIAAHPEFKP